jgi:hypothetical protein
VTVTEYFEYELKNLEKSEIVKAITDYREKIYNGYYGWHYEAEV